MLQTFANAFPFPSFFDVLHVTEAAVGAASVAIASFSDSGAAVSAAGDAWEASLFAGFFCVCSLPLANTKLSLFAATFFFVRSDCGKER